MAQEGTKETNNSMEDEWSMLDETISKELETMQLDEMLDSEIPTESALDEVAKYVEDFDESLASNFLMEDELEASKEADLAVPKEELDEILATEEDDALTLEQFDALMGDALSDIKTIEESFEQNEQKEANEQPAPKTKSAGDVYSDSLGAISSLDDKDLEEQFNSLLPDAETAKEAEPEKSMMQRLFSNIEPENPEAEIAKMQEMEKEKEEQKKLKAEEKKKKKEEKAKLAQEKKAAKAAQKEAKAKEKAELKEQKKKEKEELMQSYVPEGKLNKVGVSIVVSCAAVLGIVIVAGSFIGRHHVTVENAEFDVSIGRYAVAYESLSGSNLKGEDKELYNKVQTVMLMKKQQSSYENFKEMNMEVEALDSLLKGLERYDEYYDDAKQYGVEGEYDTMKSEILSLLKQSYSLSEEQAAALIAEQDATAYTKSLTSICNKNSGKNQISTASK